MKNLSVLFIFAIILSSCKTEQPKRDGYLISGNAPGVYNGIRAYLKIAGDRGRQVNVDTAIVMNEKFVFEGKLENPALHFVTVDNVPGSLQIIFENGEEIALDIDKSNIIKSTIVGSETNDKYQSFNEELAEKRKQLRQINTELRKASANKDTVKLNELQNTLKTESNKIQDYSYTFIDDNPNSPISLILLEQQSKARNLDTEKFLASFNSLGEDLKNSQKGISLKTQVNILMDRLKKEEALKIGKPAPLFTAPDQNGNKLGLNDLKGKVTIVDFWASWCGPCRRENPNVVKVYEKYHDKGLEIVGVSLDRPGQKERWLKAIEDDKLNWNHVSNLQYFNDPVAKMYNISSIPATYILDEKGTIVAKNLRGSALETKIAELLN